MRSHVACTHTSVSSLTGQRALACVPLCRGSSALQTFFLKYAGRKHLYPPRSKQTVVRGANTIDRVLTPRGAADADKPTLASRPSRESSSPTLPSTSASKPPPTSATSSLVGAAAAAVGAVATAVSGGTTAAPEDVKLQETPPVMDRSISKFSDETEAGGTDAGGGTGETREAEIAVSAQAMLVADEVSTQRLKPSTSMLARR